MIGRKQRKPPLPPPQDFHAGDPSTAEKYLKDLGHMENAGEDLGPLLNEVAFTVARKGKLGPLALIGMLRKFAVEHSVRGWLGSDLKIIFAARNAAKQAGTSHL